MNDHFWLLMMLGPVITLLVPRLFIYLARMSDPLPEEIHIMARPLDWEHVKITFDANSAKHEISGYSRAAARRMLRYRFAVSREYLLRMKHNIGLIEICSETDQRDKRKFRRSLDEDKEPRLSEALAMLEGARIFESDALTEQNESEADKLRNQAASLRLQADELCALVDTADEDRVRKCRMFEALQASSQFRAAVRCQLIKVGMLMVLLRLDKLSLMPAGPVIAVWREGNSEMLFLYRQARIKGTEYLSAYHRDKDLLTRAWEFAG